ncbi:hypothetical protein DOJK_00744 [Patescibacteria group bacterium]|nr:hypothetical protein DOJK_00744 [Patescibacteria group bacterium]
MGKENRKTNNRMEAEIERDFDNIFGSENLAKAEQLYRELNVLSTKDLLKSFTI